MGQASLAHRDSMGRWLCWPKGALLSPSLVLSPPSGCLVAPWPLGCLRSRPSPGTRCAPCQVSCHSCHELHPGDQSCWWPCPPHPPGHSQGLSCSGRAGGGREPVPVVVETLETLTRHFVWCHQLKVRHWLAGQDNE